MRCALLPPFPFFHSLVPGYREATSREQSNAEAHGSAGGGWNLTRMRKLRVASCGWGVWGYRSSFMNLPVVLPIPPAAPAPSGCGDEDHGIAHLAVYCSLLALFATSPQVPEHTSRTVRAHSTMRAGCLGISECIYESGVLLPALAAAPAPPFAVSPLRFPFAVSGYPWRRNPLRFRASPSWPCNYTNQAR